MSEGAKPTGLSHASRLYECRYCGKPVYGTKLTYHETRCKYNPDAAERLKLSTVHLTPFIERKLAEGVKVGRFRNRSEGIRVAITAYFDFLDRGEAGHAIAPRNVATKYVAERSGKRLCPVCAAPISIAAKKHGCGWNKATSTRGDR